MSRALYSLDLLLCAALLLPAVLVRAQPSAADDAADAGPADAPAPALELPVQENAVEFVLPQGAVLPANGIELTLSISPSGDVVEVTPRQELAPDVARAMRTAALSLRFRPARRHGEPIAVQIGYAFKPSEPEPEPEPEPPSAAINAPPPTPPTPDAELATFGARAKVERPPPGAVSRIKLQGAELREVPGTFGEPLRVVATLPGVMRTPFGLGFFVVRGAAFQNTGFFVDDYPVPLLYHLGAGPAIIASRLVDSLDFYPGGYPVDLGRYTAGVIALHTAPPATDRLTAEFELDALRASGLVVVPLPDQRGSIALAFRRSYFELLLPLITDDVSLSYTDYQVRLDLKITRALHASVLFFGSRDSLETKQAAFATSGGNDVNSGLHYAFDQVIAALDWTPDPRFKLRWSGTIGPSEIRFSAGRQGADSLGTDTTATRLGERLTARILESDQFETRFGADLDVLLSTVSAAFPSNDVWPNIPSPGPPALAIRVRDDLMQLGFAPFVEQVLRLNPFELTLGMRAEYLHYARISQWVPEPRAVMRVALTQSFALKAGTGLFSQAPLPFQVLRDIGNPSLLPNRALQSSVGVEIKLPAQIEIESSLFYNWMWQLTRPSGAPASGAAGAAPRVEFYADDGFGRAYGFELMVRRRLGSGLFGWLSYTLSRSERFLSGGAPQVFSFDQTHVLNVALSYTLGTYRFGARYTLATGRPMSDFYDPTGQNALFDSDGNDYDPALRGRTTRLPTYHQLDVRIDRDWSLGPLTGSVYIDIINVYNAQNGEAYQYEYDFSKRGKLPGLPFLPTLGIRGVLK
ncbi:MAG: hypothetical protein RL701_5760 [Pseudomonadota bacterium]